MTTYKVKSGDTLSKIAKQFNTTVSAIQKANPERIKNINRISIGWTLNIPTASKDYEAIGKQVEKCLTDIENLHSFKELCKML